MAYGLSRMDNSPIKLIVRIAAYYEQFAKTREELENEILRLQQLLSEQEEKKQEEEEM